MAIETLDDIIEDVADKLGIYGEERIGFTMELKQRIREAAEVEQYVRSIVIREATDDELSKGTFSCPVCGLTTPHSSEAHKISTALSDGSCGQRFIFDEKTHICGLKFNHERNHVCKDCRMKFGYQYST